MTVQPVSHVVGADPTSAVVDGALIVFILSCLDNLLAAERRRAPAADWPQQVAETLRHLRMIGKNWRESAGARREAELAGNGQTAPATTIAARTMMAVSDLVRDFGIPERSARRFAARHGTKVGGRWLVRAEDVAS